MRAALALALLLAASAPLRAETLPSHKVVSVDDGEARRLVSVRLDRRLGEAELERIANARKGDHAEGKRTLVNFYLPGQKLSDPSWASAAFAPALKIAIHGLSLEEEAAYRAEAARESRATIGMWLTQAPAVAGLLTIYREKGKLFADWRVRGGHRTVEEVVETRGHSGRRFDIATDTSQHYVLIKGGELELREKSGLIAVAEPVRADADPAKAEHGPAPKAGAHMSAATAANAATTAAAAASAHPAPAPANAQRPAVPTVKSPFSPVLGAAQGGTFTVTETARDEASPAAVPAATAAPAAPKAAASIGGAPTPHEAEPSDAAKSAAKSVVHAVTKKRLAKAASGAGANKQAAAQAPAKPVKSWRVEADVSVLNKRVVN